MSFEIGKTYRARGGWKAVVTEVCKWDGRLSVTHDHVDPVFGRADNQTSNLPDGRFNYEGGTGENDHDILLPAFEEENTVPQVNVSTCIDSPSKPKWTVGGKGRYSSNMEGPLEKGHIVWVHREGQPKMAVSSLDADVAARDAALIAAAPDLLAALKGVLRVADRATDEFDAACVAIAKAEGRLP